MDDNGSISQVDAGDAIPLGRERLLMLYGILFYAILIAASIHISVCITNSLSSIDTGDLLKWSVFVTLITGVLFGETGLSSISCNWNERKIVFYERLPLFLSSGIAVLVCLITLTGLVSGF